MKTRAFALIAIGLLACQGGQTPPAATLSDPRQILAKMAAVYASASTYTDHGTIAEGSTSSRVRWWFLLGPSNATFTTNYRRSDVSAFSYRISYFRHVDITGKPATPAFQAEMTRLFGVTYGLGDVTLRLFVPSQRGSIATLTESRLLPMRRVHHHDCYVITGDQRGHHYTLSIDRETFLLLRVEIENRETVSYRAAADYWPEIR